MTDHVVRAVDEALRIMAPALREILAEHELAATTVRAVRQPRDQPMPALEM